MHEEGKKGTGSADKTVLIMGDSLGVMRDIETVWRAGTMDELRLRHRRAMVEDIVGLRRSMKAVVFLELLVVLAAIGVGGIGAGPHIGAAWKI